MRAPRRALGSLGSLAVLFALLQGLGAWVEQGYTPEALRTSLEPPRERPARLILAASYGDEGVIPELVGPGTSKWVAHSTAPSTWERVLPTLPRAPTVVLATAPCFLRSPGVFKDLPLRRLYGLQDLGWLVGLGQLSDASEVLADRALPLYRARQGLRRSLWRRALGASTAEPLPKAHHGLPAGVAPPWEGWSMDPVERAALERTAAWAHREGVRLVVAEWPLSQELDPSVHAAVVEGFRPALRALSEAHGFDFLPLPAGATYTLRDAVHPSPEEGARWSRWLGQEL